jgi:hypothetical protein
LRITAEKIRLVYRSDPGDSAGTSIVIIERKDGKIQVLSTYDSNGNPTMVRDGVEFLYVPRAPGDPWKNSGLPSDRLERCLN